MRGIGTALSLGLRDLLHDRAGFATQVMALVAVLVPLLILYSLWVGVIGSLVSRLAEDPRNRQIIPTRQGHFPPEFFTELQADRRVDFVVGHASPIAREVSFTRAVEGVAPRADGVVLGSGPGDPLLGGRLPPPGQRETVLSAPLAARLKVAAGGQILLTALRGSGGQDEELALTLTVVGIMPLALWESEGALLAEETLSAVEQWRDGFLVPAFGWPGNEPTTTFSYRNFRLYARDLPALQSLHADLTARGLPVSAPRLKEYEGIVSLDAALGMIFGIIAAAAGVGFLLSFGATLWGNVERKRHALSALRLYGLLRRNAALFPVAQAVAVVAVGWVLAWMVHAILVELLKHNLASAIPIDSAVGRLDGRHALIGFATTLAAGLLASASASWHVMRIEPGEGIHGH